jgi:hypothetical protein
MKTLDLVKFFNGLNGRSNAGTFHATAARCQTSGSAAHVAEFDSFTDPQGMFALAISGWGAVPGLSLPEEQT